MVRLRSRFKVQGSRFKVQGSSKGKGTYGQTRNNVRRRSSTPRKYSPDSVPSSRSISVWVTVIILLTLSTESTRKPVIRNSVSAWCIIKSNSSGRAGSLLLIKATTTYPCGPISSVKQSAGRTFVAEKSSNGNGSNTILPRIMPMPCHPPSYTHPHPGRPKTRRLD